MFPNIQPLTWGGLRGKFMLFIGSMLVIITATVTLVEFRFQHQAITDREVEKASSLAEVLLATVEDDIRNGTEDHLQRHLESLLVVPEVRYVYAFDENGHILSDGTVENKFRGLLLKDEVSLRSVTATRSLLQFNEDILDATEPLMRGEQHLGGVRIGYSL
ncbi:MAG: hypothetical protein R3282_06405, partial [Rhodothermales bacterium]|nr:hypothetical protein [Rhodothermales bacterium]